MTAGMEETAHPLDLGFQLDFTAGAVVLADDFNTFLIINVLQPRIGGKPQLPITAVCTLDCLAIRYGYPNDEPRPAIERFKNLGSDMVEIFNSTWATEVERQNRLAFPDRRHRLDRHLMFLFKDSTFECLCDSVEVAFHHEARSAVIGRVAERLT